ncbi:hypothetical protein SpCBS45565_g07000 [Spizellomyces sp. 'palustris']|nr:hypothetical protein SpCBS45565_g07000 [Spizellomyces sp. 'palustris']
MSIVRRLLPSLTNVFEHNPHGITSRFRPGSAQSALAPLGISDDVFNPLAALANVRAPVPAVDVKERPDAYIIEAEVPGLPRSNIDLEVIDDHTLALEGRFEDVREVSPPNIEATDTARTSDKTDLAQADTSTNIAPANERVWSRERVIGSFRRLFTFPDRIDAEKISAKLKDGVLQVEIPKEETQGRKVRIAE